MKAYVLGTCALFALLVFGTAGFCLAVDPYRVFGAVQAVEYFEPNVRLWKTNRVHASFKEIDGYILGDSRAAQLPPGSIGRSGVRYFNYATSSETTEETFFKLTHVYGLGGTVREVVLFLSLDALSQVKQDPRKDLLRQDHPSIGGGNRFGLWCRYLLSTEAISASWEAKEIRPTKRRSMGFVPDGTVTYHWQQTAPLPVWPRDKPLGLTPEARSRELEWHRKIAELAVRRGTKVCVVISPLPASRWQRCMEDSSVQSYLAEIAAIYGGAAISSSEPRLYSDPGLWNDSTHPSQRALVDFISPLIRNFFSR